MTPSALKNVGVSTTKNINGLKDMGNGSNNNKAKMVQPGLYFDSAQEHEERQAQLLNEKRRSLPGGEGLGKPHTPFGHSEKFQKLFSPYEYVAYA
jgi:hypothetical protein